MMAIDKSNITPISLKMSLLIALMMVSAVIPVVLGITHYIGKENYRIHLESLNETNRAKAKLLENLIWGFVDELNISGRELYKTGRVEFQNKKQLKYLEILKLTNNRILPFKFSSQLPKTDSLRVSNYFLESNNWNKNVEDAFRGMISIKQIVPNRNQPYLVVLAPIRKNPSSGEVTSIGVGYFAISRLEGLFRQTGNSINSLMDRNKEFLMYNSSQKPYLDRIKSSISEEIKSGKISGNVLLKLGKNSSRIVSYTLIAHNLLVLSEIDGSVIRIPILKAQRRSIFIAIISIAVGVFITLAYSLTLTIPLENLVEVVHRVTRGNLKVRAADAVNSYDELGVLAQALDKLVTRLKRGEKMKDVLSYTLGSKLSSQLINSDMKRGGIERQVTLFFLDIRNFTRFSDSRSPSEIVDFLNDFFQTVVSLVNNNKGQVNKFLGDGLLAAWGGAGEKARGPNHALKTALEIRVQLNTFNEERLKNGLEPVQVGMAIHSGTVVSGLVGSEERLEYTFIGDTVNICSRIEQATKRFTTDVLVSQSAVDLAAETFLFEKAESMVQAKGVSEDIEVHYLLGYIDKDTGDKTVIERKFADHSMAGTMTNIKLVK